MTISTSLEHMTMGEFVRDKKELYFVDEHATLEETVGYLREKKVFAVPVFSKQQATFIGIFDVIAMAGVVVLRRFADGDEEHFFDDELLPPITVGEYVKDRQECQAYVFLAEAKLQHVLHAFAQGIPRVLVQLGKAIDPTSHRMVTNTDIVKFFRTWTKNYPEELWEFQPLVKQVEMRRFQMEATEEAVRGFVIMWKHQIYEVSVIEPGTGRLVGTLSAKQLRGLTRATLKQMLLPVTEFLKTINLKS